jgi:hypothetical protein
VTGLAAAPSILLILGSLFLAAWRVTGRRTGWAAEAGIASVALLAGLLLGRSIPAQSSFALWPPGLSPSASIELDLTPWSWALLVCVLAFGVFRALRSASNGSPSQAGAQSASLIFTAMIAISTVAASLLTLVLLTPSSGAGLAMTQVPDQGHLHLASDQAATATLCADQAGIDREGGAAPDRIAGHNRIHALVGGSQSRMGGCDLDFRRRRQIWLLSPGVGR